MRQIKEKSSEVQRARHNNFGTEMVAAMGGLFLPMPEKVGKWPRTRQQVDHLAWCGKARRVIQKLPLADCASAQAAWCQVCKLDYFEKVDVWRQGRHDLLHACMRALCWSRPYIT